MHWMICSAYHLGCMVVNINAFFAEWIITGCDYFQILVLGILSSWTPLLIFRYRCWAGHFPGFGKYIFPQLQTCTALILSVDSTGGYCSSNIVIFSNFLVVNFFSFNFEQSFPVPWVSIPSIFSMLYYTIN